MDNKVTQEQALAQLNHELSGIMDQALKNQWLNVISRVHDTQELAIRRFATILANNGRESDPA